MKKVLLLLVAIAGLSSCSIKKVAFNSMADMLAPPPYANAATGIDPMIAITGENDPELVRDFFPTALKLYEILHLQNPGHEELGIMTGQLYIMYANAFVQTPAEQLPPEQFSKQDEAYHRAQNFYLRGKNYVLDALNHRYTGFSSAVFGSDEGAMKAMLGKCSKKDTPALYWAASGTLGAFALSPLDSTYVPILPGSLAMLERAAALDPAFSNGAIWEVLMAFYAAAPESLGGGRDKALDAYAQAIRFSGGKSPSTYIAYVRSFCIPAQDGAAFDENIEKALAINPDAQPDNRLVITIAQRQAKWLKDHKAEFILE